MQAVLMPFTGRARSSGWRAISTFIHTIPKKGAAPRQLKHTLLMSGARLELAIIPPLAQRFWHSSSKVRVPTKEAVAFCTESDRGEKREGGESRDGKALA